MPLVFSPGEAYQFDWSHEYVVLAGVTTKVKVAHVRLCHSRMFFVRAYPRESQEMVFDAHDRAFRLFQGACRRGIYDNMKTAVQTVLIGKERAFNRRFVQMCGHYLVEPTACTLEVGLGLPVAIERAWEIAGGAAPRRERVREACHHVGVCARGATHCRVPTNFLYFQAAEAHNPCQGAGGPDRVNRIGNGETAR